MRPWMSTIVRTTQGTLSYSLAASRRLSSSRKLPLHLSIPKKERKVLEKAYCDMHDLLSNLGTYRHNEATTRDKAQAVITRLVDLKAHVHVMDLWQLMMRRRMFPLNAKVSADALGILIQNNKAPLAIASYGSITDCFENDHFRIQTHNVVLYQMLQNNMLEEARQLFKRLQQEGPQPNISTYNQLILGLNKLGRYREAHQAYKDALEQRLEPTLSTYNALMKTCLLASELQYVPSIVAKMKAKDIEFNGDTYANLVEYYGQRQSLPNVQDTFKAWTAMESLSTRSFVVYLEALYHCGAHELVLEAVKGKGEFGIKGNDVRIMLASIRSLLKLGEDAAANTLYKEMLKVVFELTLPSEFEAVIDATLLFNDEPEGLFVLLQAEKRRCETKWVYSDDLKQAFRRCARERRREQLEAEAAAFKH